MTPRIRTAQVDDIEAILDLWRVAGAEPSATDSAEALGILMAYDAAALIVAEAETRLVASVIAAWDGWRGSIYRLVVAPGHRRIGLARRMVRTAEHRLSEAGASRLQAIVVETDDVAASFWRATDWEQQVERLRFVKG